MVLAVNENAYIQALECARGYLKLPNGQALGRYGHTYKRHVRTTLFGALEVATGKVKTGHRRRRRDFLSFMNDLVADYSEQEIHVVLDNLNIHKPKHDAWLARNPRVHLHLTPTCTSWLNQVEIWFSILACGALRGASFTPPQQLREAIDAFVEAYNETANLSNGAKPSFTPPY